MKHDEFSSNFNLTFFVVVLAPLGIGLILLGIVKVLKSIGAVSNKVYDSAIPGTNSIQHSRS